jgi:hypothetical protein
MEDPIQNSCGNHAITLNIRGQSYRLKDKLKASLVKPVEAST